MDDPHYKKYLVKKTKKFEDKKKTLSNLFFGTNQRVFLYRAVIKI